MVSVLAVYIIVYQRRDLSAKEKERVQRLLDGYDDSDEDEEGVPEEDPLEPEVKGEEIPRMMIISKKSTINFTSNKQSTPPRNIQALSPGRDKGTW